MEEAELAYHKMLIWDSFVHGSCSKANNWPLLVVKRTLWLLCSKRTHEWRSLEKHSLMYSRCWRGGGKSEDPFYKIRPLINHIIYFTKLPLTEQRLTIDESMIRFNGRSKMKLFMPLKPIKYGFKVYVHSGI